MWVGHSCPTPLTLFLYCFDLMVTRSRLQNQPHAASDKSVRPTRARPLHQRKYLLQGFEAGSLFLLRYVEVCRFVAARIQLPHLRYVVARRTMLRAGSNAEGVHLRQILAMAASAACPQSDLERQPGCAWTWPGPGQLAFGEAIASQVGRAVAHLPQSSLPIPALAAAVCG